MNDVNRLVAAAACGALAVVCVAATGEGAKQACSESARAGADQQTLRCPGEIAGRAPDPVGSGGRATRHSLVRRWTRQLSGFGSQLAEVNATVASLSDRDVILPSLALLFIGIRNAWDIAVWMTIQRKQ